MDSASAEARPLLQASNLEKRFGGVHALAGASLGIETGETMALVGDNGAAKSTFVKALSAVQPPDSGEIRLRGQPVSITSPREAGRLGIEVVYQDLALANSIDVPGNVFLKSLILIPFLPSARPLVDDPGLGDQRQASRSRANDIGALGGRSRQSRAKTLGVLPA